MSKKIYLGIPYSKVDKEESFKIANKITAALTLKGYHVFSPISMSHQMAKDHDMPTDWKFWEALDRSFIEWCDELWVVCMDGWEESTGVMAEIEIANDFGKKIFVVDPLYPQKIFPGGSLFKCTKVLTNNSERTGL